MRQSRLATFSMCASALSAVLVLLAACGGRASDSNSRLPQRVAIGRPAPAYEATTTSGDSVSLTKLRGHVVLLNVWATWCQPCRSEIPDVEALAASFADRGLQVIGVSIDGDGSDGTVAAFAREFGMTYPIWRDPDERILSSFRLVGVPATFLIDREGVLRWRTTGPIQRGDSTLARAMSLALAP